MHRYQAKRRQIKELSLTVPQINIISTTQHPTKGHRLRRPLQPGMYWSRFAMVPWSNTWKGKTDKKCSLEATSPFCCLYHDKDIINYIIRIVFAPPLRPLHGSWFNYCTSLRRMKERLTWLSHHVSQSVRNPVLANNPFVGFSWNFVQGREGWPARANTVKIGTVKVTLYSKKILAQWQWHLTR